jgi:hypothetical protein
MIQRGHCHAARVQAADILRGIATRHVRGESSVGARLGGGVARLVDPGAGATRRGLLPLRSFAVGVVIPLVHITQPFVDGVELAAARRRYEDEGAPAPGGVARGNVGRRVPALARQAGARGARFMFGDLSVECCVPRPYFLDAVTGTSTGLCLTERW